MELDRTQIGIKLIGGPCDGETGPPTDRDEIEVVRLPKLVIPSLVTDAPPIDQALPYQHRYRRNMRRPWEFEYRAPTSEV